MRHADKKKLVRGMPFYVGCLLLLTVLGFLYFRKPPQAAAPLRQTIARYLENGRTASLTSLDAVIDNRETWQLILGESVGQRIEDFEFSDIRGGNHRLTDFAGGPLVVVLWATWSPACTMQFGHLQELRRQNPGLIIVAFSSESQQTLERYATQNDGTFMLVRQQEALPRPLSEISDIPAIFFIDRQSKLFLACRGLMPFEHADAILGFMEPKPHEPLPN
ncbi:MAG: TlpA family protein disulfide reductase [Planctomycetaceae bacterium]|nr:TlpA family protein disulfide reductase [Planctomycetaceae bacterium]